MTSARSSSSAIAIALTLALGAPHAFAQAQAPAAAMPAPAMPAAAAPEEKPLPPDTVLATVNGKKITQLDVTMADEDVGANLSPQLKGKAREGYLLGYLIDGALVAQKAKADKLEDSPEFSKKMAYVQDKVLMEALMTRVAKGATSDAALHKIYDEAAKQQKPQTEMHARHILVATEADAQAVLKRLKAGEDFAKVAKEVSKDPSAEGGELPWFTREQMVPAFADAAFALKDGQTSEPVKSQFGWHVIQVEGRREKGFPPFDQVKDQILRYAIQRAQSEMIIGLRKNAKIERTSAAPAEAPEMAPAQQGGGEGR